MSASDSESSSSSSSSSSGSNGSRKSSGGSQASGKCNVESAKTDGSEKDSEIKIKKNSAKEEITEVKIQTGGPGSEYKQEVSGEAIKQQVAEKREEEEQRSEKNLGNDQGKSKAKSNKINDRPEGLESECSSSSTSSSSENYSSSSSGSDSDNGQFNKKSDPTTVESIGEENKLDVAEESVADIPKCDQIDQTEEKQQIKEIEPEQPKEKPDNVETENDGNVFEKTLQRNENEVEKLNESREENTQTTDVKETDVDPKIAQSRSIRSPAKELGRHKKSSRSRSVSHERRFPSHNRRYRSRSRKRSRTPSGSRSKDQERRCRRSRSFERRRRSISLERRREERKRRHAEREKQEADLTDRGKKSRHDGKSSDDHDKSSAGSQDARENDNETVTDPKSKISERQRRTVDLLTSRTGGAYIPPAKLRMMQAEITDKSSAAYQRIAWEALKKSIHGYINKVNVDNIAIITRELLKENIVRGRGLLCRSIIQAQAASPTFTHVYAALVSIINSKFPNIGELLLKRLVIQFKRAFRRNDKAVCLSASRFVAHLVNQRVAHEILALEILTLLVETPTDDSVEVAIAFLKECGMKLTEVSSKGIGAIFEMLKNILHEGKLDKRVQYMIEVVFQVRKDGFKDHQSVIESLELVEEDDQFTHLLMLDEATNPEDALNAFKFDDKFELNEDKYKGLSKEILGSDASDSENSSSGSESDTESDNSSNSEGDGKTGETKATAGDIIDNTETNLIALRRTIYLTINSSLDYEECAHKLMKMQLKPGQEIELCHMFLDCCAEQRTYEKFYGLLAQRFCSINKIYIEPFEEIFRDTYQTTHRLDTNRLRNVSKFFAHLLFTDAISWDVLECIQLNEDDTTSSSRIFIKILFQELAEYMGLAKLNSKLKDEVLTESLAGLFPKDNPRNTRFAINFFTSIGLGGLTDDLRQFLKNAPKSVPAINAEILGSNPIALESSSSSTSSSSSSSPSESLSETSTSASSTSTSSSSDTESSDSHEAEEKKLKQKIKKRSKRIVKKNGQSKKIKDNKTTKDKQTKKCRNKKSSEEESKCSSSSDASKSDTERSSPTSEMERNRKRKSKSGRRERPPAKKSKQSKEKGNSDREKNRQRLHENGNDGRKGSKHCREQREVRKDKSNRDRTDRDRGRGDRDREYDRHYDDRKESRDRKMERSKTKSSCNASKERG